MADLKMPLPSERRALELGAAYIEAALDEMRQQMAREEEQFEALHRVSPSSSGTARPLTSSHEMDLMKAAEWATAAAILRMMAKEARG